MKLTLSHADVTLALCEFLATRGMTAFDPTQVSADFSFKRGSKELLCELDTEPKAPVEVVAKVAPTAIDAPADLPKADAVAETVAETVAPVAEIVNETAPAGTVEGGTVGTEADNLFD